MFGRKSGDDTPSSASPTPFQPARPTGDGDVPSRPMTPSQPIGSTPRRPTDPIKHEENLNARKLIVGREIILSGSITACDHLIVEGTVEATVKDCHRLEVFQSGLFKGAVEIGEAEIAGRVEGEITIKGRLTVHSTGHVQGTIQYGELSVEAGGTLEGQIRANGTGKKLL
jgi:cytoskeletal protein CcmA (bactofilin family)